MLTRAAPAKLNLSLHISGKRADGYHELESLVVFIGLADQLTAAPAEKLTLKIDGPFADACGDTEKNLVMKAARALHARRGASLTLTKNIPTGAGLGGGSSDAAAALLLLNEVWGLRLSKEKLSVLAQTLGADVPMFLHAPTALVARGIGEKIEPLSFALPELHAVLVYPNKPLATAEVYGRYSPEDRAPMGLATASAEGLLNGLAHTRNDLQRSAIGLMPEVAEILLVLETVQPKPLLARMSGSGSACFALYRDKQDATNAEAALARSFPRWWVKFASVARQ